ncbi:OsmC family protein [Gracilimonas mengyeensis]|uniref:Osmotically inducible protein OsmC n=1 Tax=Gracilimonas mengyeensis TaxID=1302730 RepID=A0A521FK52_9BACT|nr:OsmC family protein [Gracilimonas mengyeensis]SMO96602.1 osmotically inducible protein OsmC [Gracilimonas mengyeensis]
MPTKKADAKWTGDLKSGSGTMKLESGSYEGKYSFATRFEDKEGSNPEELIGAAHAGCYSMAFSNELDKAGFTPNSVETHADVVLESTDDGPAITTITLTAKGDVPGIDDDKFQEIAEAAKKGCPVSKALAGVNIKLDATLVNS